jgi:hypothetical protein
MRQGDKLSRNHARIQWDRDGSRRYHVIHRAPPSQATRTAFSTASFRDPLNSTMGVYFFFPSSATHSREGIATQARCSACCITLQPSSRNELPIWTSTNARIVPPSRRVTFKILTFLTGIWHSHDGGSPISVPVVAEPQEKSFAEHPQSVTSGGVCASTPAYLH